MFSELDLKESTRIGRLRGVIRDSIPRIYTERILLYTESYRTTEGDPVLIRQAKAVKNILENISVDIRGDELIVGALTPSPRGAQDYSEFSPWIEEELDTIETRQWNPFYISPDDKRIFIERIIPYWKGRSHEDRVLRMISEFARNREHEAHVFTSGILRTGALGHYVTFVPKRFNKGLNWVKEFAKNKIESAEPTVNIGDLEKILFWKAIIIVCDAAITFSRRYAKEALRLAKLEKNLGRKKEFENMAEICEHVPANPPRTFHEALQTAWFYQLIGYFENNGIALSPGRLDQKLYSYYRSDKETRRLTDEEAQELLDCFWVKFAEPNKAMRAEDSEFRIGNLMFQAIGIGGQNSDGLDATNELSYMCLKAEAHTHMDQPNVGLRVHGDTPDDLLLSTCQVISTGGGKPQLFGDPAIIKGFMNLGLPVRRARDWDPMACSHGWLDDMNYGRAGDTNMLKVLELALNNGIDLLTGKQVGPQTGEARNLTSIDDLMLAFAKQWEHVIKYDEAMYTLACHLDYQQHVPHLWQSLLTIGCLENGKDVTNGGAIRNFAGTSTMGLANVVNSLAAIKKVVFDDGKASMSQLLNALAANFEGYEELRFQLLNAPKYGNDDPYVDTFLAKVTNIWFDILERMPTLLGGNWKNAILVSQTFNIAFGRACAASPDGRKARDPLADATSPSPGTDTKGPTSVLKSVARFDHSRTIGTTLNQKFHPSVLAGKDSLKKFASLIKTYLIQLEGSHIQVNVVSKDTLLDAQVHPEKYKDLLIRVAGYTAYFVELSKDAQDHLIERTEHGSL